MEIGGTVLTEIGRDDKGRLISSRANQVTLAFAAHDDKTGSPGSESMSVANGTATMTVSKVHDDHGRLMQSTTPAGTWNFTYDGWGNLLSKIDPDGVEVSWQRSPSGYLLGARFFDGSSVTYSYDGKRRTDEISSANGAITYGYGGDNLTNSVNYPDGTSQLIGTRNGFFEPSTITHGTVAQTFGYDAYGRVTSISCPTGDSLTYDYDALGRRRFADLGGNRVTFGYQPDSELISETYQFGFMNAGLPYSQNLSPLNHLQLETYPSGLVIAFGPDPFGDATTASNTGVNSIDWFAPGAPLNVFFGNEVRVIREYDPALRLTGIRYLKGTAPNSPVAAGFRYELTPAGRVEHEEKVHLGEFDVYTRNGAPQGMRVTGFAFGGENEDGDNPAAGVSGFGFVNGELQAPSTSTNTDPSSGDIRGFHPSITYVDSRPGSIGGTAISYDGFGSMTAFPLWVRLPGQVGLAKVEATASYDGFANLRQVDRADGVVVKFTRDGLGRIIRREVSGPAERVTASDTGYIWAGDRLLEEYADAGSGFQLVRRYVYLTGTLLAMHQADTPGGALTTYVPVVNRAGSVSGYLNLSGDLLERIDYSAYGVPVFRPGNDASALHRSAIGNTLLFQGGFYDDATGLYQFGKRTLHPMVGMFLQRDNELFTQHLALFTAFNGDPAGMADPTGLRAQDAESIHKSILDGISAAKMAATTAKTIRNDILGPGSLKDRGIAALKLSNKYSEDPIISDEEIDLVTGTIDHIKTGKSIYTEVGNIRKGRELLAAVQSVQNGYAPTKGGRWGWLNGFGASATSGLPSAVSGEVQSNKWYRGALITRASSQDAIDQQSEHVRKEFLKSRKKSLLAIGSGLTTLSAALREKYLSGSDHPSVVSNQGLKSAEKIFGAAKAGISALEEIDGDDVRKSFLNPRHMRLTDALSVKSRNAVSAAWTAGFELGKFMVVALSDPETTKEYSKAVKSFEKNGGFVTVASGVLSTFGFDETAYAIQQYQDYNLMDDITKPITNFIEHIQSENVRQAQYLQGIKAP